MILENLKIKTQFNNQEEQLKTTKVLNVKTQSGINILFEPEINYSFVINKFNNETLYDFIEYHNKLEEAQYNNKMPLPLTVYIDSPGGYLHVYNMIKDIIENSNLPICLVGSGEISSAAFLLLYFTRNVNKRILPYSMSIMHSPTSSFDYRDLLKSFSSNEKTRYSYLSEMNKNFLDVFEHLNVFDNKTLSLLEKGEDIFLNQDDLHNIFLKCPFGVYDYDPLYFKNEQPEQPEQPEINTNDLTLKINTNEA